MLLDREKLLKGPKEPTPENLLYPQIGRLDMNPMVGAHTAMPLGRIKIEEFAKDADKGADAFASEIDKTSDAAFMEQSKKLDELLNPKADPTTSMQGAEIVSQQPTEPVTPSAAQTSPVQDRSQFIETRPLEPSAPSAPSAPVGAGAGRGFVVEPPGARAAAMAMPPANGGQRRGGHARF